MVSHILKKKILLYKEEQYVFCHYSSKVCMRKVLILFLLNFWGIWPQQQQDCTQSYLLAQIKLLLVVTSRLSRLSDQKSR